MNFSRLNGAFTRDGHSEDAFPGPDACWCSLMRERWLPHNGAMRPLAKRQTFGRCQGSTEYTDKLISTQRGTEQAVAVQEAKPDDVKAT